MGEHQLVLGGKGLEFVFRGPEGITRQLGNPLRCPDGKLRVGVEPGSHCRAPQGQVGQRAKGQFNHFRVPLQHGSPAADFLGKGDGGGVLQMGATALHDSSVGLLQLLHGGDHFLHGRQEILPDGAHGGDVHGRGEGVVGALGHIHMVVGVKQLSTGQLIAPVCNDLVDVHVGLGAGARLPYGEGEMTVQLAGEDFVTDGADGIGAGFVQLAKVIVYQGGSLFQVSKGPDDFHGDFLGTDSEILQTALGLGTPVTVSGYLHLAHGVVFYAVFHTRSLLLKRVSFSIFDFGAECKRCFRSNGGSGAWNMPQLNKYQHIPAG